MKKLINSLFHSLNKIGHALHDLDPVFNRFSRSPQMKQLVTALGLDDYLIIQSMLIFKHARIGAVVDIHQDAAFLYIAIILYRVLVCIGRCNKRKRLSLGPPRRAA